MNQSEEDALVQQLRQTCSAIPWERGVRLAIRSAESIGHARGVKEERERAAKVIEDEKFLDPYTGMRQDYNANCDELAAAIREGK